MTFVKKNSLLFSFLFCLLLMLCFSLFLCISFISSPFLFPSSGCRSRYFHPYVDLLSYLYLPLKFHLSLLTFFFFSSFLSFFLSFFDFHLSFFLSFFLPFFLIRYATALVAWWEIAMFFIFAFAYKTILTVPTYFCVWYVRAIRKYFGEKL